MSDDPLSPRGAEDAGLGPARYWTWLTGALMAGSLLAMGVPALLLDWQPEHWITQPWRLLTAASVHWSEAHLLANLLAAAVVGAYGSTARVPTAMTLAWMGAWPLTHLGLLLKPELLHYGGLSGVLHAGVAIVCLHLLVRGQGLRRWIGGGVALGLVVKLWSEEPWGAALQKSEDWDIALAPLAHATGALAGLVCGLLALLAWRQKSVPH